MMFTQFHQIKRDTLATITLNKAAMVREIECATYKLASSTVPDESVRDNMQVDVEESLDSTLIVSYMDKRAAEIEEMLLAFSDDDASTDVDDSSDDSPAYVFRFAIEKKFKKNLKVASRYMHNYIVTGSILDWHKTNGSQYSLANDNDMIVLKSKIVNLFRGEFVKGGYIPDMIHPTR